MPGKFLPFVQPILQQLPWELPSEGLLPPARRMAEIIVKVYSASAISPMPYAEVVASLDKLTNPGSRTLEEASPRVKAQLYAMKVSISQASSGSVHSADEHVEVAREYEYVMQLARAYDRGLINFEKWTEYSSGLMDFLEKHPKAATKFQLVRNLHSRFVQAQRGAHVE
ncbi:hypothetical protein O9K51_10767 [Purpureocillium lavendulum]|uniref:Uncharacterized protein n=1 Tax=Purpureocillium lavendulum TaxID=1247861 RepID=A0AB34FCE6_9HYPO|nr:hypothetical protein O9K51_10767 [Purpureocillium lavendulum]